MANFATYKSKLWLGVKILGLSLIFGEALWLGSAVFSNYLLKVWNPKTSAFIQYDEIIHRRAAKQQWKDLAKISPSLMRAVLVAEDDAFFEHEGIDWKEMKKSWELNLKKKKMLRGASTLSMQLSKNLYLSPDKNPLRKINEMILTHHLEKTLSKKRIFELYLNLAQWGPGIYGAEAASQYYFNRPAAQLSSQQAAYLAALLPNPIYLNGKGKGRARYRQRIILERMSGRSLPNFLWSKGEE